MASDLTFKQFRGMVKQAAIDSRHLSGAHENHPSIQYLLNEEWPVAWACLMLEDDSIFQAFALLEKVPEDQHPPIPDYYRGRVSVVLECYRYWALERGHVAVKYDPAAYWVEDKDGNRGNWH